MAQLLGEYECKIDAKGRMRLPAQLLKQLGEDSSSTFVMNRGLEKHLVLYPKKVWDKISAQVDALNAYDRNNRKFVRYFYRGAQQIRVDGADRILINKRLLDFAEIGKEVVLFAQGYQIEVWSKAAYEAMMDEEPGDDIISLAENVMSNITINLDDDGVS